MEDESGKVAQQSSTKRQKKIWTVGQGCEVKFCIMSVYLDDYCL